MSATKPLDGQGRVESHQILRLHGGVEDLLSFKVCSEEVPMLFVSATIAISKRVHLPALLGYQEQQIYRVPITVKTTPGVCYQ